MSGKKLLKSEFVYEDVKKRILMNEFSDTHKLPSENELAKLYACSRPTLQKALRRLINEGMVTTIQGSGTYINKSIALQPPPAKPSLVLQGQSLYGLIFPNLGPGYIFKSIADYIAQHISLMNYSLIWGGYISPTATNLKQQLQDICSNYINLGLKGVFFSPFEYNEYSSKANAYIVETLTQAGIPIVLIDTDITRYPARSPFDLIGLDHVHAGYTVTSHMLGKGVKKILFLSLPYAKNSYKLRLMGFHEALLDHGITSDPNWLVTCKPEHTDEVAAMMEKHKPDGIITLIDRAAVNLVSSLRKLGISVPQDVLVGSFDDLGHLFDMSITSIRQPLQEISKAAIFMMQERERDLLATGRSITFCGELIEGVSTNPNATLSL